MNGVCAGIITYNPNIECLEKNLQSVLRQISDVYVVDNHSENMSEIGDLLVKYPGVELIKNEYNAGIAFALNQLCKLARDNGKSWILTLDQDTLIDKEMMSAFEPYMSEKELGIICPDVDYSGWGSTKKSDCDCQYVYACMTSASLTRINAWEKVGGFREDYFIDFVDNEFCMKLHINNYKILRVNTVTIIHELGESGIKRFLVFKIKYSKHSPRRLYYMSRNNSAFIKEYKDHLFVLKEKMKLHYVLLMGFLFSDDKRESLKYIFRGLNDAKNGIMGEYK